MFASLALPHQPLMLAQFGSVQNAQEGVRADAAVMPGQTNDDRISIAEQRDFDGIAIDLKDRDFCNPDNRHRRVSDSPPRQVRNESVSAPLRSGIAA